MKKWLIPLVMASLMSASAMAADKQSRFQFGISFEPFFPQGEFRDVLDRIGWGGSLDAFYRIPKSDLMIGTALAYHVYGLDTRWEPLSVYIPEVMVKVRTTNAVFRGHLLLRLQPSLGGIRPYVETLVGLQHLTTDTRVYDDYDYDDSIASTNQLRSTVLSYGFGGGLVLNLSSQFRRLERRSRFSVLLDIGIRYLKGGSADYLVPGDMELSGDTVTYFINRSHTDILTPRIGVSFAF